MADIRRQNKESIQNTDLDVLLALKTNIFKTLKVATLAQVTSVNGDIITASIFPLYKEEDELNLEVQKLKNIEVSKDDIVLILFLDRNFNQNLKQTQNKQERTKMTDLKDNSLHSYKQGIIIGVL